MRKINAQIVFLTAVLLLIVGCDRASSQSSNAATNKKPNECGTTSKTAAPVKNYEDYDSIGERTNGKYNLNFQITSLNNENWKGFDIAVKKAQTKRCLLYKTAYFDEGLADKQTKIFSPDEEFLALPCGNETYGYCIYKMSQVAEYFGAAGNFSEGKTGGNYCGGGMDTFKTPIAVVDAIKIVDSRGGETYAHKLVGWKSNTALVFQVKVGGEWHEFSYDAAKKKISGAVEKIGAAKNQAGTIEVSQ